jgi:DnaK suppressor protein
MPTRLDAATASDLSLDELDRLRRLLVDERTVQEARAIELREPIDLEPDLADVLLERCNEAIEQVDAALSRMEAGSYGSCLACGGPIPYERLEIVPAADRCVGCQADRNRLSR